jgi:hypothetical protein
MELSVYKIFIFLIISYQTTSKINEKPKELEQRLLSSKLDILTKINKNVELKINENQNVQNKIKERVLEGHKVSSSLGSFDLRHVSKTIMSNLNQIYSKKFLMENSNLDFKKDKGPNEYYERYRATKKKRKDVISRQLMDLYNSTYSKDMHNRCLWMVIKKKQEISFNR